MTRKLRTSLLILTVLMAGFMAQSAWATTYYVATNGSNSAAGTQTAPWQSLSYACSRVSGAGNTIYVNAGSYTDNTTANLALGVKIQGAGSGSVTINTTASPYIKAVSGLPTVDGSNEVSGISFVGGGSNPGFYSQARNNQKVHDCNFKNFKNAIDIRGKLVTWSNTCGTNPPTQTTSYCDDDPTLSIEPATGDWATGAEIYNNKLTNARIYPGTVKGASIHDNVIDNSSSLQSGIGNTTYYWNGVQLYNNSITLQTVAWSTVAIEAWMVEGDTKFYNNVTNGIFSILKNPNGPNLPYSWEIVNNTFASNVVTGIGSSAVGQALETCYNVQNVLIAGNYFVNTGSNNTYDTGIGIHGYGVNKNFTIRNNVFYNIKGDGIDINTNNTIGKPFTGSNINIYNNVFDTLKNGSSQGVYIDASGQGSLNGANIKNNVFKTVAHGALTYGSNVSGIVFTNNDVYGASGNTSGSGFSSTANNININPAFEATGSRPIPYYNITSTSNLLDKGANVGLPYTGSAPDLGAFEYMLQPYPPTGVAVSP